MAFWIKNNLYIPASWTGLMYTKKIHFYISKTFHVKHQSNVDCLLIIFLFTHSQDPNIETISLYEYRIHCLSNHNSHFSLSLSNSEVLGNILKLPKSLPTFSHKFHTKAAVIHSFIWQSFFFFFKGSLLTGRDLEAGSPAWKQANKFPILIKCMF